MEIEKYFHSAALAVGLKPSASQGKARLRGLERIIAVLRYVDPCPGLPCRARRPLPAECRPKFISVIAVSESRIMAVLRYVDLCLDFWSVHRRTPAAGLWRLRNKSGMRPCRGAEALGYGMQSPPARARAESLLKDHNPWLRSGKPCGLDQPGFSRIWQGYLKRQPRRGFHALREGLSPHVLRSSEEVQPL